MSCRASSLGKTQWREEVGEEEGTAVVGAAAEQQDWGRMVLKI